VFAVFFETRISFSLPESVASMAFLATADILRSALRDGGGPCRGHDPSVLDRLRHVAPPRAGSKSRNARHR